MPNRITGMYSGLDTESLIQDLMKAKSQKKEKLEKTKTKLEWKQEAWTTLNNKIKSFYSKTVSNFRWASSFVKKTTTVSNTNAVDVITGENAMDSVQTLSVKSLASSGYLTGAKVTGTEGNVTSASKLSDLKIGTSAFSGSGSFNVTVGGVTTSISVESDTTIGDVVNRLNNAGVNANFDEKNQRLFIGAKQSGTDSDFTITATNASGMSAMTALGINATPSSSVTAQYTKTAANSVYFTGATASDWVSDIQAAGVDSDIYKKLMELGKSNFQKEISAKEAELAELQAAEEPDEDAINALSERIASMKENLNNGIYTAEGSTALEDAAKKIKEEVDYAQTALSFDASAYNKDAKKLTAENAVIELNGARFESQTNSIEVNGITYTCKALAEDITVTTQNDTEGIYNMVKDFIKEYNELMKEFSTLYNAETTKLEPLTEDEKNAVSDSEIEKLEGKVKESLLRRDESLNDVMMGLREVMLQGITVGDQTLYLTNFGIGMPEYLTTTENERNLFHIDGDPDDEKASGNADKLKGMIASDPSTIVDFFTQLGKNVYSKLSSLSSATDDRSFGSFYNDKLMKNDVSDYTKRISDMEDKLQKEEDKLYRKFAAMETALAKMSSSSNYLSSLFTTNN